MGGEKNPKPGTVEFALVFFQKGFNKLMADGVGVSQWNEPETETEPASWHLRLDGIHLSNEGEFIVFDAAALTNRELERTADSQPAPVAEASDLDAGNTAVEEE